MRHSSGQKGYTLMEALVVVAIVGIVSVVTIPNFIQYMRSAKLKNASRQFAIDLREARQRAVTRYHPTKIAFKAGAGLNEYMIVDGVYDSTAVAGIAWTVLETEDFEDTVYFSATNLSDSDDSDDYIDVVFLPNGKIVNGTNTDGSPKKLPTDSTITIASTDDIPKTNYTVEVHSTGKIRLK